MIRASRAFGIVAALTVASATGGALLSSPASAVTMPSCPSLNGTTLTQSQQVSPANGHPFVVCTGRVRTFDGTPIHFDITLPTVSTSPGARHPLMLFLSGWSNDVCQFESTTLEGTAVSGCSDFIGNAGYHWNNAWFASHGWVTINYTPRGWYDSCGKDPQTGYTYTKDSTCNDTPGEESWVHLYDRRYEIRDAQFFAGLVVDSGWADPSRIVTTGDSGGGGPSWDLALSQDQVVTTASTPTNVQTVPWTSPSGTPLHLLAALPLYTWTDLVDALVTNGRASDGFHGAPADGNHQSPVGVEKQTYVSGLFALGTADAQYAAPNADPSADLTSWYAEVNAGEPYDQNPNLPTVLAQIGGPLRSPFAIPVPAQNRKPIFVIQGLTDPLFPATHVITMIKHLNSSGTYPVWAFLGDVGHSYADNPLDVWQQAHAESNAWLYAVMHGKTPPQPRITVDTTRCVTGQTLATFHGPTLGSLAGSQLTFSNALPQTTVSSKAVTPEGKDVDPIANSGCRSMASSQSDQNQASYTFPLTSAVTLVGSPVVKVSVTIAGSSAELAARLWDLDGSGNQTLITRTVYRIEQGSSGSTTQTLTFELWPNAWQLQCGHSVKLELTQDDAPTWRPDNEPATITVNTMQLSLPVVTGSSCG